MNELHKSESEFDIFFHRIGYTRVSDDVGQSPSFENADYVNKEIRSVVELKILNKEFFQNGGLIDSLNAIIVQPQKIDEKGFGLYKFEIPNINRENKHDNFEEPLRRIIKKANRQLRSTRDYYWGKSESYGFLLIAQDGLSSLSPEITGRLIQKILRYEFSYIDGVIVCTPYFNLINPVNMSYNPECVSITNEIDKVKKELCISIADNWIEFLKNSGHKK